jgi:hypothetical protein
MGCERLLSLSPSQSLSTIDDRLSTNFWKTERKKGKEIEAIEPCRVA